MKIPRTFFCVWGKKRKMLRIEGGLKMSVFTAKMLKEARNSAGLSQDEAANAMKISRRKLQLIEANEAAVSVDDIVAFARLYRVDVRELILDFLMASLREIGYIDEKEEQILCNRYSSFLKMFDQLSDKDKEDIVWVIKQRIKGRI